MAAVQPSAPPQLHTIHGSEASSPGKAAASARPRAASVADARIRDRPGRI